MASQNTITFSAGSRAEGIAREEHYKRVALERHPVTRKDGKVEGNLSLTITEALDKDFGFEWVGQAVKTRGFRRKK